MTATLTQKPEVTEVTQGIGGQPATGEPEPKAAPEPKPEPQPRYAPDMDELSDKVLKARELVGRGNLAEFADQSQSAIWRWERSRVHPGEVEDINALVKRIEAGELPVPERPKTGRVDRAIARLEAARKDKVSKATLVEELLAILNPTS